MLTKDLWFQSTYLTLQCKKISFRNDSRESGLIEAIVESIKSVHTDFYGPLMKNIYISGGTAQFQGFKERVDLEMRKECDAYITPKASIIQDNDITYKSLLKITQANWFEDTCMNKSLYNELGFSRLAALI